MGRRLERFRRRREDAAKAKSVNHVKKSKERVRRDARMVETIKDGEPPYAPAVMSWLSRKLEKPASRITPEDVNSLVG